MPSNSQNQHGKKSTREKNRSRSKAHEEVCCTHWFARKLDSGGADCDVLHWFIGSESEALT